MYKYDSKEFMSNLYEGVYIVDKHRKIVFWNSGSEHITGYKAEEIMNHYCYLNILKHVDKDGKKLCLDGCPLLYTLQTGQSSENEIFLEHKLGHRIPVSVKTFPLYNEQNEIIAAVEVFSDMKYKEEQLEHNLHLENIMRFDTLTKIYNRRYLEFQLGKAIDEANQFDHFFGLLFIDIDYFKTINDTYGHIVGDEVLAMVANTLRLNLRSDDFVGRWGGEEFLVLVNTDHIDTLTQTAERLRVLCENSTYKNDHLSINVTISIGGSMYKKGSHIKSIIESADKNMYLSKKAGRNKITIS